MKANVVLKRTISFTNSNKVSRCLCGGLSYTRKDYEIYVPEKNRRLGGGSSILNIKNRISRPKLPEPIGNPHPFLSRVYCDSCGLSHDPESIHIGPDTNITFDSAQVEYDNKLDKFNK